MNVIEGTYKQSESESDRKRQNSDLQVGDRIYEKKIKLRGKILKVATNIGRFHRNLIIKHFLK